MSEKKSNWDKIGVFAGVATTLLSGYVAMLVYGMNLKFENLRQAIQIESDTKYESKVDHSFDFQQLKLVQDEQGKKQQDEDMKIQHVGDVISQRRDLSPNAKRND